jgi:type IV pilus assembly protein PilA
VFCPACGNNVAPGERFCRVCGKEVSAPPTNAPAAGASVAAGVPSETSGKALASLISGLFFFFLPAAIVAVIFGHLSLSDIRKSAGRLKGKGMAMGGLILGYFGISFIPFLIIAAIVIPSLLRARMAANESAAVSSLRTLNVAEVSYSASHANAGYTCSLSDLSDLMDTKLASGQKSGYAFELSGCTPGEGGATVKYQVAAYPVTQNTTGTRAFCSDESAVVKFDGNGSARNCLENGSPLQ